MKDVDAVIKYVAGFERAPMCSFIDPQQMKDTRQQKRSTRDNKRKEKLQEKRQEKKQSGEKKSEQPEKKQKAPIIKNYKKQDKPAFKQNKKNEKNEKNEKAEKIEINVTTKDVKFFIPLDQFPAGTGDQVVVALRANIKDAKIVNDDKEIKLTCSEDNKDTVEAKLKAVVVNKKAITYKQK